MPSQPSRSASPKAPVPGRGLLCSATTTGGQPCRRQVVPGLTVCRSHGGATAASVRAGKRAAISQQTARLWGISSDTGSISVEDELNKLARNKLTDIIALRLELSKDDKRHIGLLTDSKEVTEAEVA